MSLLASLIGEDQPASLEIRVRGRVQGVGFRPTVWRIANELRLSGEVLNDATGVIIRATGPGLMLRRLVERLRAEPPALATIESIESYPLPHLFAEGFRIGQTERGRARTEIAPDAAICAACAAEVLDPLQRRHRYPFANCTECGPRLTILTDVPYDRAATTMAQFPLCASCAVEYENPLDRRFHAEAIACPTCGPKARLIAVGGHPLEGIEHEDAVGRAAALVLEGSILAVKGLGGYQLCCDATNAGAVSRLRAAKNRESKPFALMARDLAVVSRYCRPTEEERRHLTSAAAPIVLMEAVGPERLPDAVAPGLCRIGFMLPTTPLHLLLLQGTDRPVVMTSGNVSGEPQVIDDEEALTKLATVGDHILCHDRRIANRVDDSVVRVHRGAARVLRRARGWAPAELRLPPGFEAAPDLLAFGGELKSTFCLLRNGKLAPSQHQGDLEDAATFESFRTSLALYARLFDHEPAAYAIDQHPDYLSSKLGRDRAHSGARPVIEVQHHHAHVAACLADNLRPLTAPPVLGIVLDGLGWGEDGTIWGGEFLLADYTRSTRLGAFKPVPMIGGSQAAREPWRSLYAHLTAELGWAEFAVNFAELELFHYLSGKPRDLLDTMLRNAINVPLASSCGRLFDAVAAALGLCRERQGYEGEAACRLEAIVDRAALEGEGDELAYPFAIPNLRGSGLPYIEPLAMWRALLGDLILRTPAPVMAARFHKGLARAIAAMAVKLARAHGHAGPRRFDTIALSGGCFQNEILLEDTMSRLEREEFTVLTHREIPPNDGGLSIGQAVVGAARLIAQREE